MFVNKYFEYLGRVYLRKQKCYDSFDTLFLCKDENVNRFSDLH